MMGNGIDQSRTALLMFANQPLLDFVIPVILSTIYIAKEKIGRGNDYAVSRPLRTSYQYSPKPRAFGDSRRPQIGCAH